MQNAPIAATPPGQSELQCMLSTLYFYDGFFGPFHPQTLRLKTVVADAYRQAGEADQARLLLETVVRDSVRCLGPENEIRLAAIETLRDLLASQGDYEKAGAVQREVVECRIRRLGQDHPETLAARARLCELLSGHEYCRDGYALHSTTV